MLYDLTKKTEVDRYNARSKVAIEKGWLVEMTNKTKGTLNMNNNFHLICAYFGLQTGYSKEHVKQKIIKLIVCPDIFVIEKPNVLTGEMYETIESWADIGHEKQNLVINKFIKWSWDEGEIRLPDPNDLAYLKEVRVEVERNKQYL